MTSNKQKQDDILRLFSKFTPPSGPTGDDSTKSTRASKPSSFLPRVGSKSTSTRPSTGWNPWDFCESDHFLGWLSDPFNRWLVTFQIGNQKVTAKKSLGYWNCLLFLYTLQMEELDLCLWFSTFLLATSLYKKIYVHHIGHLHKDKMDTLNQMDTWWIMFWWF